MVERDDRSGGGGRGERKADGNSGEEMKISVLLALVVFYDSIH